MYTRLIGCLLIVMGLPWLARASSRTNEEIAAQAEAAFTKGVEHKSRIFDAPEHFAAAAAACRELHERGVRSPALYANLGNAAVLANRWPEAIWAYHLGLTLDPNDAAMREHLAFARGKVIYPPAGQGRLDAAVWPTWLHRPTVYELSLIAGFSYTLAWVAGTCTFFLRGFRSMVLTMTFVVLALVAGSWLWHEKHRTEIDRENPIVVLTINTEFYRGNGVSYPQHPVLPVLPRGMEVRQLHRRGQWLQIRLTTGEFGWVPFEKVLVVSG